MTDDPVKVTALLRRARRRLLVQRVISGALWGCVGSLGVALLVVLVHRLVVPAWSLTSALAWILPSGPIAGLFFGGLLHRRDSLSTALELERRVDLRQRISSVLTLRGVHAHEEVKEALLRDGERHAAGVDLSRALPYRRPLALLPGLVALLALAGAYWLFPELDLFGSGQDRERKALAREREKERVDRIRQRARRELERIEARAKEAQIPKETRRILAKMQERVEQSARKEPERRQALVGMQKMRDELRERRDRSDMKNLEKFLNQVRKARPMESPEAQQISKALKQGNLEKAAQGMQQLSEKLQKALQKDGLDSQEAAALKRDLQRLSDDLDLSSMDDLMKKLGSLESLDPSELSKLFDKAGGDLADLARLMRERELLDEALDEIKFSQDELAALPAEWPESDDPG